MPVKPKIKWIPIDAKKSSEPNKTDSILMVSELIKHFSIICLIFNNPNADSIITIKGSGNFIDFALIARILFIIYFKRKLKTHSMSSTVSTLGQSIISGELCENNFSISCSAKPDSLEFILTPYSDDVEFF
ncbi:hypothetical protein MXB_4677, partial [Myxobolus squamalis]